MRLPRILAFGLLLAFALAGCAGQAGEASDPPLVASGFLEAQSYDLASEVSGRVVEVWVADGDSVSAGQDLVRLEVRELTAALAQAEAGVRAAQAALDALRASPRPEELAAARADLEKAQAQASQARAQLALLEASYAPVDPPLEDWHAAQSAVDIARAGVEIARARLAQIEAGPAEAEWEVARAALEEARANRQWVQHQLDRLVITAPVAGRVGQVLVKRGEVAVPGQPLLQVREAGALFLTVYVPEARLSQLSPGQPVDVRVDAYPDRVFPAVIQWVAGEAQFTPANVQTEAERVKLVFAVTLRLQAGSSELKAGMPADAYFPP